MAQGLTGVFERGADIVAAVASAGPMPTNARPKQYAGPLNSAATKCPKGGWSKVFHSQGRLCLLL